jgi:monoamine oxidase
VPPAPASVHARPDPGAASRVVVVGAGLAGLTAAIAIRDAGWEVVVLEARARVGGRVHTLYGGHDGVELDAGVHAEAGGESIDESHTALLGLARRFGVATEPRPGSTSDRRARGRVHYRGTNYSFDRLMALRGGTVLADYRRVYNELARLAAEHDVDPEHPAAADRADELDRTSFATWLNRLELVPEARFVVEHAHRSLYNSELEDLSMLFIAQQMAVTAGIPAAQSETMRIAGGNATLPRALAAALGAAVVLDAPVTAVRREADVVTVVARDREYVGAHVVIAAPPPPLRRVQFDPPLPAPIATAIAELDLGPATKVVNQYRTPFWRGQAESGYSLSDLTSRISWDPADSYAAPVGLLTTYTTAGNGHALAALPADVRIARVRDDLARVFPEGRDELAGPAATVAWSNEPFTGGGYAVYRPGQVCGIWDALRAGTDRIHFAGEHLEALAGYMESAVRSGRRAATRIGAR